MKDKPHIFLDIDGVLATSAQFYMKKRHEEWGCYSFDPKCVKVFNVILEKIDPVIILSSDWKLHYTLETLDNIFKWNGVMKSPIATTSDLWGEDEFKSLSQLEEVRSTEILRFVEKHEINKWIAIDDLNLSPFIPKENFVHTPRVNEGIKQSGVKDKIIKKLS